MIPLRIEPATFRLIVAVPQPTTPPRTPSFCMSEQLIRVGVEEAKEKRLITRSKDVSRQILLPKGGKWLAKSSGTLAGSTMSDLSTCKLS